VAPPLLLTSCGKPQNPNCQLKTVNEYYHQYKMAMDLTDKGRLQEADQKLVTIFNCNKKFAPAYAALSYLRAYAYTSEVDPKVKKTLKKEIEGFMKKSLKYAKDDSQEFIGHVTAMRVYTLTKFDKKWLKKVKDHFEDAIDLEKLNSQELPYYRNKAAAYYFMGLAYYEAGNYRKAEDMLKTALNMSPSGKWIKLAENLLEKVQQIERVSARYSLGALGKEIAKKDTITRAELAAILVDEINLPELFVKSLGTNVPSQNVSFIPSDIENNPYKSEILTILKLGIRGLKPVYVPKYRAWMFLPNKPVDRCDLAFVLEDVYAKITNNNSIKTKYLSMTEAQNPFKDLHVGDPCFNPMMNAVNLGLLKSDNGYVYPHKKVSGAEALEAIYKLRDLIYRQF